MVRAARAVGRAVDEVVAALTPDEALDVDTLEAVAATLEGRAANVRRWAEELRRTALEAARRDAGYVSLFEEVA